MVDTPLFKPAKNSTQDDERKCNISSDEDRCDSEPSLDLSLQLRASQVIRVSDRKGNSLLKENIAEENQPSNHKRSKLDDGLQNLSGTDNELT